MRNMSFSMTTEAVRNRAKTVTRRLGWDFLKPGDLLRAVAKSPRNLRKGEELESLAVIRVVHIDTEPLSWIDQDDCKKEGFPNLGPEGFIDMFCREMLCSRETRVRRIEFQYVEVS